MRMPRPRWTPSTDEQRRAVEAVTETLTAAGDAERAVLAAIAEAKAVGVPVSHLAELTGLTRPTIYRHLPPADPQAQESGPTPV